MEYVWDALKAVAGLLLASLVYWVRRLDKDQERQDMDIKQINRTLITYSRNVGIGDVSLQRIEGKLDDHIRREEEVTWTRIEEIDKENRASHDRLTESLTQLTGDVRELVGIVRAIPAAPIPPPVSPGRLYRRKR